MTILVLQRWPFTEMTITKVVVLEGRLFTEMAVLQRWLYYRDGSFIEVS